MIQRFKINNPLNYTIILIVMLILWSYRFIFAPTPIESYDFSSIFMSSEFENAHYKILSPLITFIFLYIFSVFLTKINSDLVIVENAYQMPGLLFAIFTGFYINSQRLFISVFAGLILFLSLMTLCYADKQDKTLSGCFNAGLLFIVSVLLYPKLIVFLPLLFITLSIIKSPNWREIVLILGGIAIPIFIISSLLYLYGDINIVAESLYSNFKQTFLTTKYERFFLLSYIPIIIWALISVLSVIFVKTKLSLFTRSLQIVTIVFLLSFIVLFLTPFFENETIIILFAPVSLLLSKLFINTRRRIAVTFFTLLIINVILCQTFQIIFYQTNI